jgi:hypothetical protein
MFISLSSLALPFELPFFGGVPGSGVLFSQRSRHKLFFLLLLSETYVAVTCPVESDAPSREARIQQGEDERNPAKGETDGGFPTAS